MTRAFDRLSAELLDYVHANQRLYHVLFPEAPGHREQAMEPLRHLVARLLSQAMDQGALTRACPGQRAEPSAAAPGCVLHARRRWVTIGACYPTGPRSG